MGSISEFFEPDLLFSLNNSKEVNWRIDLLHEVVGEFYASKREWHAWSVQFRFDHLNILTSVR